MTRRCRWPMAALGWLCLSLASTHALAAAPSSQGAGATAQGPSDAQVVAKVDAYMRAAVAFEQFTGAILVARNGRPIIDTAYGMANYELDVPNTPATVYPIASLTKQFTAAAILQLQEQGKLKVGDPVCNYLDDCPTAWRSITLHQLLTHTSGIPNYSSLPEWDEVVGRKTYRRFELVDLFRDLPLQFAPGEQFRYSNSGYVLLGLVIERASGQRYGAYLHDRIFAPLGMQHSVFEEGGTLVRGRAAGYYSRGTQFVHSPYSVDPSTSFGSAGIASTTADLLRWDQALYNTRLLSQASLEAMFTPNLKGYGYGWQVGEALGRRKFDHSGSNDGYSSYILRFPDERVTVIVLGNGDRMSAGRTGSNLATIVFGGEVALPKAQLRDLLWDRIVQRDVQAAIAYYRELRRTQPTAHDFGDEPLVDLGYDLISASKLDEAAAIFDFNLEQHPDSAYSYDGLADIALEQGDKPRAIGLFERSLAMDPDNDYAKDGLKRLRPAQ